MGPVGVCYCGITSALGIGFWTLSGLLFAFVLEIFCAAGFGSLL